MPQPIGVLDGRKVRSTFKNGMERTLAETSARSLAYFVASDSALEEHGLSTTTPQMQKIENGATVRSAIDAHKVVIANEEWARQLEIKRKDWERADDPDAFVWDKVEGFGMRVGQLPGRIISQLMLDGLTRPAYTGANFYAAGGAPHDNGDGDPIVNNLSTTELTELVVADDTDIQVDEFVEAILGVIQHMRGFTDDAGAPINDMVRSWLIEVPTSLYKIQVKASRQSRINGGDTNVLLEALNSAAEQGETFRFRSNPWLRTTDPRFWVHVLDGDGDNKPFIFQEEIKPEITHLDSVTDPGGWVTRRGAVVDAYWRGAGGFARPQKSATALFAES